MRYSLYIGRFQPFHDGHVWCINEMITKGKKVCIAVMDIHELEPKNNPYSYKQVFDRISEVMANEIKSGKLIITKIPAIDSVNYGRDVGYKLIQHDPPENIRQISATKIRSK
jgi:cytidyltransferase-like protein